MNSQILLRQKLMPWFWLLVVLTLSSIVWAFITLDNLVQNQWIEAFEYVVPRALGALICFLVARVHTGRARLGWLWVAAAMGCYSLASLTYQVLLIAGLTPFPSVADIAFSLNPLFLIIGFFLFVEGRFHPRERLRLTLDALIIAMVVSVFIWYALLAPALAAHLARGTLGLPIVLATLYLTLDLVVLGVLLVCMGRWTRENFQRVGWWFLIGIVVFSVADGYFLARCFLNGLPTSHPLETGWNLWALCFSMAGLQSLRVTHESTPVSSQKTNVRLRQFGVYGALLVVLPLVIIVPQNTTDFQRVGVQVGIGILVILVIARQLVFSLHLEQANKELQELSVSLEERVQQRTAALSFRASHDLLTGLANRDVFEQALSSAISDFTRVTAVLFMDLDRFKQINDSLGHALGDQALREVAWRMQQVLPENAMLARHGGDEFMLLLPRLETVSARATTLDIVEQLLATLQNPICIESAELYLDMSIGISFAPLNGSTVSVLEQQADTAMYFAKRNSSRYAEFSAEMRSETVERLEIEGRLRRDLEQPETAFWMMYQPIVELSSQKIIAVEALLRHRTYATGQIIPLAEESGIIVRLGTWSLEQACTDAARWDALGFAVPVSVNVSTVQFERPDFVEVITEVLQRTKLRPELLELELLERVLVTRFDDIAEKMMRLRQLGVHFALDDFGTGYSSLAYLHRLPFDTIKIDRSFVQALNTETRDSRPLIDAVYSIARAFGFHTVVEGVETAAEIAVLTGMGANLIQGYYFAKPLKTADLEPLLKIGVIAPVV